MSAHSSANSLRSFRNKFFEPVKTSLERNLINMEDFHLGVYDQNIDLKEEVGRKDLQYHGTTTLAFINHDSVIICVDSKASIGSYVGSTSVKKIFPISSSVVATMAGGAADCAYWIRNVAKEVRQTEFETESKLQVKSVARLLSDTLRKMRGIGIYHTHNIFDIIV
jgi:20S proteasome subunit beta 5